MNNIIEILKLTDEEKHEGVWLSGVIGEGEYKRWGRDGRLEFHCFFKNGRNHGELKEIYVGNLNNINQPEWRSV